MLESDNGEATIKAYLSKSKDNHIPASIWSKLDYDTRNKILEIRNNMEKDLDKKDGMPPQYTKAKANLAGVMEEAREEVEEEEAELSQTEEEEFNTLLDELSPEPSS